VLASHWTVGLSLPFTSTAPLPEDGAVPLGGKSINLFLRFVSNVRTSACPLAGCGAVNSTALRAVTVNGNGTGASSRLVSSISEPLITSPGHSGASATRRPWLALCNPNGLGLGSPGMHEVDSAPARATEASRTLAWVSASGRPSRTRPGDDADLGAGSRRTYPLSASRYGA